MHEASSLWDGMSRRVIAGAVYWGAYTKRKLALRRREKETDEPENQALS